MFRGVVKWFDPKKGFGFIRESSTENDLYVHFSAIVTNGHMILFEGQEVSFEKRDTPSGIEAVNVRILS